MPRMIKWLVPVLLALCFVTCTIEPVFAQNRRVVAYNRADCTLAPSPTEGFLCWDTDDDKLCTYNGSGWECEETCSIAGYATGDGGGTDWTAWADGITACSGSGKVIAFVGGDFDSDASISFGTMDEVFVGAGVSIEFTDTGSDPGIVLDNSSGDVEGFKLYGAGARSSSIIYKGTGQAIQVAAREKGDGWVRGVTIKDILIDCDGDSTANTEDGVNLTSMTRGKLTNVHVHDCSDSAFYANSDDDTDGDTRPVLHMVLDGCVAKNNSGTTWENAKGFNFVGTHNVNTLMGINTIYYGTGLLFDVVLEADADGDGTHTGAADAATLTDGGKSWTNNEWVGQLIRNTTDFSECTVQENDATTITCALEGGVDSDWDAGDAYQLYEQDQLASGNRVYGASFEHVDSESDATPDGFYGGGLQLYQSLSLTVDTIRFEDGDNVGEAVVAESTDTIRNVTIRTVQHGNNETAYDVRAAGITIENVEDGDGYIGGDIGSLSKGPIGGGLTSKGGNANLIPDASIECWGDANTPCYWTLLDDTAWDETGVSDDVGTETTTVKYGSSAALLGDQSGWTASRRGMATPAITIDDPMLTHTLVVEWRTDLAAADLGIGLRFIDSGDSTITSGWASSGSANTLKYQTTTQSYNSTDVDNDGTVDTWFRSVRKILPPSNTASMRIGFWAGGASGSRKVYVDGVMLCAGECPNEFKVGGVGDSGTGSLYGGLKLFGSGHDSIFRPAVCGASECMWLDLDSDGTLEAADCCFVDGGQDADCNGTAD